MIRHINEMTDKACTHVVYVGYDGKYVVESGTSGKLYRVDLLNNGVSFSCNCAWQGHNKNSECSHVLAVRMRRGG